MGQFKSRVSGRVSRLVSRPTLRSWRSLTKKMVKARRGWGSPLSSQPQAASRPAPPHHSRAREPNARRLESRAPEWRSITLSAFDGSHDSLRFHDREARGASFRWVGGGRLPGRSYELPTASGGAACALGGAVSVTGSLRNEAVLARWLPGLAAHGVTPRSIAGRRVRGFFGREPLCVRLGGELGG